MTVTRIALPYTTMALPKGCQYRIGIDLGDRSTGLAAIAYNSEGPTAILAACTFIHDGGDSGNQAKDSRKAVAGTARRLRAARKQTRHRLAKLDRLLAKHGFPETDPARTYEPWLQRARLARAYITDETARRQDLADAIRHIARHRGQRNTWLTYQQLEHRALNNGASPTEHLVKMRKEATARFKLPCEDLTVGQLGALADAHVIPLRPRTQSTKRKNNPPRAVKDGAGPILSEPIRAEDVLAELMQILTTQQVEAELAKALCTVVFDVARPRVPPERIGVDPLITDRKVPRAPKATLEFQEFRIRDTLGNLRVVVGGEKVPLNAGQYDTLYDTLRTTTDAIRWTEIAEVLDIPRRNLVTPGEDDAEGGAAIPIDKTNAAYIKAVKTGKKAGAHLKTWWQAADPSTRADLIALVVDSTVTNVDLPEDLADDDITEVVQGITAHTEAGRAAYSRETLRQLNDYMAIHRCGQYEALRARGIDKDQAQTYARPSFDDPSDHPALQRMNKIVHGFLTEARNRWGVPQSVTIEYAREAGMSPSRAAEERARRARNRIKNEKTRTDLGVTTASGVVKEQAVQRQAGECLYCGAAITSSTSQLDHIVAQARGGSNRRSNLVAACVPCNRDKQETPYVEWVERTTRPATMQEAIHRINNKWLPDAPGLGGKKKHAKFCAEVKTRLTMHADDDIDDRSIATTAYAAVEMRNRITTWLTNTSGDPEAHKRIKVYRGGITSIARKTAGLDKQAPLRGIQHKHRLDPRHHAVDAVILATLHQDYVAQVLDERDRMKIGHDLTGSRATADWRDWQGDAAHRPVFTRWLNTMEAVIHTLRSAIAEDAIPVIHPMRLTTRTGPAHKAEVHSFTPDLTKDIRLGLTKSDIRRIASPGDQRILAERVNNKGRIDPDPEAWLPGGRHTVHIYPGDGAYVRVNGGYAQAGEAHHARIYEWTDNKGRDYCGTLTVSAYDFTDLGWGRGANVLTHPLPAHAHAVRRATERLQAAITQGVARQVGWLAVGTEVLLDPLRAEDYGSTRLAEFMKVFPETRWRVSGFNSQTQVNLRPALLAAEGLDAIEDDRLRDACSELLKSEYGAIVTGASLWRTGMQIVPRRTALGLPRSINNRAR